ncbi:MAG: FAD-dependent thymidylate synthase [Peptoniphilus sp.]|nr:FAD-dependent thymidylate synthase [Peptoniphilus sp.]MDD7363188.1 FAD-dependent thymidylate synthase [Bacillota bacterium]MDY6044488.1 FAD-dependent thymidylate synthase [Peptoniphilus sp.]
MKVELIAYTPNGEATVAKAAKLCYSPVGVEELSKKLDDEEISRFVSMLASLGHASPLEHISFTFAIEGVSRVLTHQLVRHRIASYSQQSQRYVKFDRFEYVVPEAIRGDADAESAFIESMEAANASYKKLADLLEEKHTRALIEEGMDEKTARRKAQKRAIEDARYVLPNACETKIVCTMNARSLLHFFNTRLCLRAQWEIRAMALAMLIEVKEKAPDLFKHAGPPCVNGPCPEGAMTCGKIEEVRKFYKEELWKKP